MKKQKTPILIIYTGGTIGMISDPATDSLKPFNFEQMANMVPALKSFDFKLDSISFKNPIDSSDININVWVELAEIIKKNNEKYDGFVVLHGTDTMSYSASALSFMLENLHKPVIFTGSQLPIETLRTDGKENLITAIEIAAAQKNGKPIVPEVCIYFENRLYRGNRTKKYNAEHFDAFESANYPALAKVGVHIRYNYDAIHYSSQNKVLNAHTKLDTNIAILKLFPGITKQAVKAILNTENLKAVIIESFGAGNGPTSKWFIELLIETINKGIIILNVSQCNAGSVDMGKYETSVDMLKIGVIGGHDSTSEAALTKLMYLLGKGLSNKEIKMYLRTSISGEISLKKTYY